MINSISIVSLDNIMLPLCYNTDVTGNYEYAHEFLTRRDILENYSPILMKLPMETTNEYLRGLYFPILATVDTTTNSYIPLTSYAYNYLGVVPYENTEYAVNYIVQIHNWLVQSGIQLPVIEYNTMYSGYVNAYNSYIQSQQTQQSAVVEQQVQEIVEEQPVQEEPTPEPVVEEQPTQEPVVEEPVVEEPVAGPTPEPVVEEQPTPEPTPEPVVEEQPVQEQPAQQTTQQPTAEVKAFGETEKPVSKVSEDDIYLSKKSVTIEDNYSKEFVTSNSGNVTQLNTVSAEDVAKVQKDLSEIKLLSDTLDIPVFIPRLYKYEHPVGLCIDGRESQLSGMSFEQFKESILEYIEISKAGALNRNRKASNFGEEVVALISGSKSITLTNILDVFTEQATEFNYEFLYELTKYLIVDVSPNGLYDNLYKIIYLIQEELNSNAKFNSISADDKVYKTMYILSKLGCNTRRLNLTEETIDDDNDDDRETGFTFDSNERMIADATREFSTLLSNVISYDNIITKFANPNNLPAHKKVCLLGAYGESFNVDNKYLAMYGFDNLEICVKDMYLLVTYLGMKIEPTTLGLMITVLSRTMQANENAIANGIVITEEQKQTEIATILEDFSYNNTLSLISDNPKAPSFVKQYSPITYIRNLNLEGARVIIGRFEKHKCVLGFLALDKSHGRPRVYYLPPVSSIYKALLDNGVKIKGILESYDDIKEVFVISGETTKHCYEINNMTLLNNKAQILVRNITLEEIEKGLDLTTILSTLSKCLSFNINALKAKDSSVKEVEYVDANRAIAPDWVKEDVEAVNKGISYELDRIIL